MGKTLIESTPEKLNALGLYTGMGDIYLARMTSEETASTPPEYDTPYLACEGITCGLTPQYAEGSQSASDRTIRKVKILTGMDVALEYPRVLPEVRCDMLGRELDENGGESVGDGMAPLFAVGVCANRDDGTKLMRWIYKVRFAEGSTNMKTMEDGTVEYQILSVEGSGVRLGYQHKRADGQSTRLVEYVMDTANAKCKKTPEQFFAAVQTPWGGGE